jgi:hypothetical protein
MTHSNSLFWILQFPCLLPFSSAPSALSQLSPKRRLRLHRFATPVNAQVRGRREMRTHFKTLGSAKGQNGHQLRFARNLDGMPIAHQLPPQAPITAALVSENPRRVIALSQMKPRQPWPLGRFCFFACFFIFAICSECRRQ